MTDKQYLTREEAADRVDAVRKYLETLNYKGYDSIADIIALEMAASCLRQQPKRTRRSEPA